jgi:hypothetical protein
VRHLALQCGYKVYLQVTQRPGPCSGACRFYEGGNGFELTCFMITSLLVLVSCYVFMSREQNAVQNRNINPLRAWDISNIWEQP